MAVALVYLATVVGLGAALLAMTGCEDAEASPIVQRARARAGQGDPTLDAVGTALRLLRAANDERYDTVNALMTSDYAAKRTWEFRGSGGLQTWCGEMTDYGRVRINSVETIKSSVGDDRAVVMFSGISGEETRRRWGFTLIKRRGIWLVDG